MGLCSTPNVPDPAQAAVGGINASTQLQPFNYLINAAATMGQPVTYNGQTYDFSGLGTAQTAGTISDQMAQTMLDLQTETSPTIIAQRLAELQAADPQGYAARQQLFDQIQSQANSNPGRPVSADLQSQLQNELSQGSGFADAKQAEQYREQVRGQQSQNGVFLGAAPTEQEASAMTTAGEALQSQRQSDALSFLQSGASPEDIAYRNMQQNLANYGNFVSGQTPTAQFGQLAAAGTGPVQPQGGLPSTAFENGVPIGLNAAQGTFNGQMTLAGQANPWLAAFGTGFSSLGSLNNIGAFSSGGLFGGYNPQMGTGATTSGPPGEALW